MTGVTRATLRASFREMVGPKADLFGAAPFWSDADADRYLDEALLTWNLLTGYWTERQVVATTSGLGFVTLPGTLTFATQFSWRGVPLWPTNLTELDLGSPSWQVTTGTPVLWAPVALNLVAVYPVPSVTDTSLVADGVRTTPELPTGSAILPITDGVLRVLMDYAAHLGLFRLGGELLSASAGARVALWEAAGEYCTRLRSYARYREVVGARQPSYADPQHTGPPGALGPAGAIPRPV